MAPDFGRRTGAFQYAGVLAGLVVALALGAGATAAWMAAAPPSLAASKPAVQVPLARHDFDDARTVKVLVSHSPAVTITSNTTGRVTSYACDVTKPLASGTSFVSQDGTPLLALFTSVPLWRDLGLDDSGEDVQSLQSELNQLGYKVPATGVFRPSTAKAVSDLLKKISLASDSTATSGDSPSGLPLSRVLWLPARSVMPASCDSHLGAKIADGDKLATSTPIDTVARVASLPNDLIPGLRQFTGGGIQAPLNADGTITDPASLAALSVAAQAIASDSSSTNGSSTSGSDSNTGAQSVSGQISLISPQPVDSVPPSSIVRIEGAQGCIIGDGRSMKVTIVGSQLGETFVTFGEGIVAPRKVEVSPSDSARCS